MKMQIKKKIFIKIIVFFIYFFPILSQASELSQVQENDWVLGNKNAPILIIEYASLSCPHCAAFHTKTLPKIKEEYIDKGKVKLVFRDFPLNLPALQGSMVARCVGEDLHFKYLDALFSLQKSWVKPKDSEEYLFNIVKTGGISRTEFDNCLSNQKFEEQILNGQIQANKIFKIKTTPSFIINGKIIEGNKPIDTFRKIFDDILSE